jgi:16S rRNA processing protein RimM
MTPPRLLVGRVTKAHGLHGEVVVDLLSTEIEARLAPGAALERDGGAPLVVASARPHQGKWLVVFDGVGSREAAEALRGTELRAEAIEDPEALWVHELVGAAMVDTAGAACGTVVAVVANPANDLLELVSGALVPERFVVGWDGDGDGRRLVIDPPPGLHDL